MQLFEGLSVFENGVELQRIFSIYSLENAGLPMNHFHAAGVPLFSAAKGVVLGEPASIKWRVLICAQASRYENNTLLREMTSSGSDKTIEGSGSFAIQVPTTHKLNAVGSSGGESFLAQAYVDIAKCSGGVDFQSFIFCVNCMTGGSKNTTIVTACTADEAEKHSNRNTAAARTAPASVRDHRAAWERERRHEIKN
jgi:hypothetical protein